MTAFEIISNYQNSRRPPLTDADLARLWETNQSNVFRIKKGTQMPGNKTWPLIHKNTSKLYDDLQEFYFGIIPQGVTYDDLQEFYFGIIPQGVTPEPRQTTHNRSGGALTRLLRIITLGHYSPKLTKP